MKILLFIAIVFTSTLLFSQNNAQYITQSIPVSVHPNEVFTVSITLKNTGTTTWETSNLYHLGSQSPMDNYTWGINRIDLPNSVAPNNQVTITFTLTAPGQIGAYYFQWQMVQDGVAWFGDKSPQLIIPVVPYMDDSLITSTHHFSVSSHLVGTTFFHWFGIQQGQLSSPWIPIDGRDTWDGSVEFWKRMIKQVMNANIDVLYVELIPDMEDKRVNLFLALKLLRAEGWNVPKICPFLDPEITYSILGFNGNASTPAGKDEIVSHYIRFFNQYYSVNDDLFADDYIYTQDGRPVLNVWHVQIHIDYYDQLTRNDVTSRLSAAFGATHPIFNNDIRMITNAISPTFTFADEKVYQFEEQQYKIDKNWNGINTSLLKPGYWDQNVRNPGYILPRDGGIHYVNSWNQVNADATINRVQIESFNEYDEGSGIYATRTDTIYKKTDGGMNNTGSDVWSSTNNPFEYINTTRTGASDFNDNKELDARILWHNIPDTMQAGETFTATVLVRNDGDLLWNAASDFKFGEQEVADPVLFGPGRYLLNDTMDEINIYGGIFRGRVKAFHIDITAPTDTLGTFLSHWAMVQEQVAWFGDTLILPITVIDTLTNIAAVENKNNDFMVFPNPVSTGTTFYLKGTFEKNDIIQITDLLGKIQYKQKMDKASEMTAISLQKLSLKQGIYIVSKINQNIKYSRKLIITN
jgi:hypothetical protein